MMAKTGGNHYCCSFKTIRNVFFTIIIVSFLSIISRSERASTLISFLVAYPITQVTIRVSAAGNAASESSYFAFSVTTKRTTTTVTPRMTPGITTDYWVSMGDYPSLYDTSSSSSSAKNVSCPEFPPGLKGYIKLYKQLIPVDKVISLNSKVKKGGSYTPANCIPSQKVAIIIPFRNREEHLAVLLQNLHPFLQKQQRAYTIFVVNQLEGSKFNRAMLMNVGYAEAMKVDNYTCAIFHDVDLLPENDRNIYACPANNPRHMSAHVDKFGYKLEYPTLLGGVVAVNTSLFAQVNGYSNQFFGWGGEDDDFSARLRHNNHPIVRYPKYIARYIMMRHDRDFGNEKNHERFELLNSAGRRQKIDGLNTLQYNLRSVDLFPQYTRVNIEVNQREVMNAVPRPLPPYLAKLLPKNSSISEWDSVEFTPNDV